MKEQEYRNLFADNLERIMEERNINTITELAIMCHLDRGSLSRVLLRQATPSVKTIVNLSVGLGMYADDLSDMGEPID